MVFHAQLMTNGSQPTLVYTSNSITDKNVLPKPIVLNGNVNASQQNGNTLFASGSKRLRSGPDAGNAQPDSNGTLCIHALCGCLQSFQNVLQQDARWRFPQLYDGHQKGPRRASSWFFFWKARKHAAASANKSLSWLTSPIGRNFFLSHSWTYNQNESIFAVLTDSTNPLAFATKVRTMERRTDEIAKWWYNVVAVATYWTLGEDNNAESLYRSVESMPSPLLNHPLAKAVFASFHMKRSFLTLNSLKLTLNYASQASHHLIDSITTGHKSDKKMLFITSFITPSNGYLLRASYLDLGILAGYLDRVERQVVNPTEIKHTSTSQRIISVVL
ncbi:unnamed protein product [Nesidiocoris tenuis]|uniref:Uncharacterized protein n=1 Tax=Nesidiocoris tenuis TaxID=355587 RepID=A0A6H5GA32_9HEMI|nr:unnamed protein product [Nesidiocoris tenuis]